MSMKVRISQERFEELFPNDVELYDLLTTKPETEEDLFKYYLSSKLWRLNNLYTIINKQGEPVPFKMNEAQFKVYSTYLKHSRMLILKSRQQGISTFWLVFFFDDAIFQSNLNIGLMAQGADEASTLLERVKFAWDMMNSGVLAAVGRKKVRDNTREYTFNNHSTIFIRTSFRSATLQGLHISEYGKICNESPKKAKETKTGTLQTIAPGNVAVIESTAEGDNDFKAMWDKAMRLYKSGRQFAGKDFYPLFLSWLEDPSCREDIDQVPDEEALQYFAHLESQGLKLTREQKNFWIAQYNELGGDIYQEYPATPEEAFRAARDGTFWAKKYLELVVQRNHRKVGLHDHHLPVYVTVDSGRHDYFVFCFWQVHDNQVRIIGEFWHHGEQLKYYADYLKNEIPKNWHWKDGVVYLPHDFAVKDISRDDGLSREEVFNEHGIENTYVLPRQDISDSIESVRHLMPSLYIEEECEYLENCFLNYSKKWDEKLQKWIDEVAKSKYNHGADTIRYMAQAYYSFHHIREVDENEEFTPGQHDGIAL